MTEKPYYVFKNRDSEVPQIKKVVKVSPGLALACYHLAKRKVDGSTFPLTGDDIETLIQYSSYTHEYFNKMGLAIMQLIDEGILEPLEEQASN